MSEIENSSERLARLTVADFTDLVGYAFPVTGLGQPLAVTLVEAKATKGGIPNGRQPFSLLFQGPPSPVLPQAMYPLVHPSHGSLAIFIVPLTADQNAATYEAVFS